MVKNIYTIKLWNEGNPLVKSFIIATGLATLVGLVINDLLLFCALLWAILLFLDKDFREDYPNKSFILFVSLPLIFIGGFIPVLFDIGFGFIFFVFVPENSWNWLYNKVKKKKSKQSI